MQRSTAYIVGEVLKDLGHEDERTSRGLRALDAGTNLVGGDDRRTARSGEPMTCLMWKVAGTCHAHETEEEEAGQGDLRLAGELLLHLRLRDRVSATARDACQMYLNEIEDLADCGRAIADRRGDSLQERGA